jgi:hypothetical protein
LQVVGDPKVCTALLDVIHSLLGKLLGTPTTAELLAQTKASFGLVKQEILVDAFVCSFLTAIMLRRVVFSIAMLTSIS